MYVAVVISALLMRNSGQLGWDVGLGTGPRMALHGRCNKGNLSSFEA